MNFMNIPLIILIIVGYSVIWWVAYLMNKRWFKGEYWTNGSVIRTLFASFLFWWVIIPWGLIGMDNIITSVIKWMDKPSKDGNYEGQRNKGQIRGVSEKEPSLYI